jgi:hypothetical protein
LTGLGARLAVENRTEPSKASWSGSGLYSTCTVPPYLCSVVAHRSCSVRTLFESTTANYYYCRNIFQRPLEQTIDSCSVQLTGRTSEYCNVPTTCLRVQYYNSTCCVLPRIVYSTGTNSIHSLLRRSSIIASEQTTARAQRSIEIAVSVFELVH